MLELILSMTIWGTLGMFALWSGASAIEIAFYRSLIGAVSISYLVIKSSKTWRFNKEMGIISIAGVLIVLNWVLLFESFQLSSITIGNMSYYLQPILLVILSRIVYKEKVGVKNWFLIFASFGGVVLTLNLSVIYSPKILLGAVLAGLAALFYAIVTILMRKIREPYINVIFIQLLVGTVILAPFIHKPKFTFLGFTCLLVIGVFHTVLAFFLYYRAIKKVNFTTIAVLSYFDPIIAIFTDIIFFHRTLNMLQIAGICITFLSAYMLVMKRIR